MAEDRMAVLETVREAIAEGDVDFLREGVRVLAQAVMEAEGSELTGAAKALSARCETGPAVPRHCAPMISARRRRGAARGPP